MTKYVEETMKLYKYDYTEISFNIEDVCFSVYSFHNRDNSFLFNRDPESLSKNAEPSFHHHRYYEFFFCKSNSAVVAFGDHTLSLNENDILIISPSTEHTTLGSNNSTGAFNFLFRQNSLKTENRLYNILLKTFSKPYVRVKNCRKFKDTINNFMSSIDDGNVFMISRFFYQIITDLLNETEMLTKISPEEMLTDTSVSRIRKIDYLLSFSTNENISLKFIADSLNLSERQTARIIKEEFGCTLSEIIQKKRMMQAEKYLANKKMTIADISAMVGYDSINCFYSAFKKQFGCLPGEYRKSLNQKNT